MTSKYFYPIYKSFVAVKLVNEKETLWCLKDNGDSDSNSLYIKEETILSLLEADKNSRFGKFQDLIIVRRTQSVVLISDSKVSVFDTTVWLLFLSLIEKERKGLVENPNKAKDQKKLAKIALLHTFYEHLYNYPLIRHEIMSRSLDPQDHTFYEKTVRRLLETQGSLLPEFTKKLVDLGLTRFDFLYELSSADENFS